MDRLAQLTAQLRESGLDPDGDGSERRLFPEHKHLLKPPAAPADDRLERD